ncbi:MAG: adenylosuccinate synthase [Bdellovibrionota bacterium]
MPTCATPNASIVVGAQWGDEGKGKWIDILASKADIIARFQGGNNAGHTLYINNEKIVLHQIPSGIFHNDKISIITAGVVVSPVQLLKEIEEVQRVAEISPKNFWLSTRAHVITPWHMYLDSLFETNAKNPIGTTKKGIGPTYADRANRTGLRIASYIDNAQYNQWISMMCESQPGFKDHIQQNQSLWTEFANAASEISKYATEAEASLRKELKNGKKLLLEGAQGTLLDLSFGTFPFVTSSCTTSGGALASIGLSPKCVDKITGVAKAYITRVGEGPFPTELTDEIGKELGRKGNEFGATTNRPRRCGWFDAVAMRYAADINGFDDIYLNKMDILSGFKTIKVAVAYKHPKLGNITEFPACAHILKEIVPIYEEYAGWEEDISSAKEFSQLPLNAQRYVRALEEHCGTMVSYVGTGPNRQDAIAVPH